jgi:multiple sugar transport system substrate-binding protein
VSRIGEGLRSRIWLCMLLVFLVLLTTSPAFALTITTTSTPELYKDLVQKFQAAYPNIKVVHNTEGLSTWSEKLSVLLAVGEAPDVFELSWAYYGEFAQIGALLDLGPMIQRDWNVFRGADIAPAAWEGSQFAGKQIAVPSRPGHTMIYYNQEMLDAAGLGAPSPNWTWDDFTEYARKVTTGLDPKTARYGAHNLQYWGMWSSALFSMGGTFWNEAGSAVELNTPEGRNAFTYLQKLVHEYHAAAIPGTVPSDMWSVGRQAFNYGGTSLGQTTNFAYGVVNYPKGPAGQFNTGGVIVYAGNAATQYPEEVWLFMQFMMSPEIQKYRAGFGEVPIRGSVFRQISDPFVQTYAAGIEFMKPYTNRYYQQFNSIMNTGAINILKGTVSVEQGLENMETLLNAHVISQSR